MNDPAVVISLGVITFIASVGIGLILDSAIISLGQDYAFLIWTAIQLFILLSAPFYPITVFPEAAHGIIKVMPYYWVFDSLKNYVKGEAVSASNLVIGLIISFSYVLISILVMRIALRRAKKTGVFTKF